MRVRLVGSEPGTYEYELTGSYTRRTDGAMAVEVRLSSRVHGWIAVYNAVPLDSEAAELLARLRLEEAAA